MKVDPVDPETGASPLLQPPGALQSLVSIRFSRDVLFLGGICAALTLQNSSYTLLRRYSSGVLREEASSQSILAMGELLKMSFCIWMMARAKNRRLAADEDEGADDGRRATSLFSQLTRLATTSLPMAVPALIFLAMNLLSFISLRRISASAFVSARAIHPARVTTAPCARAPSCADPDPAVTLRPCPVVRRP